MSLSSGRWFSGKWEVFVWSGCENFQKKIFHAQSCSVSNAYVTVLISVFQTSEKDWFDGPLTGWSHSPLEKCFGSYLADSFWVILQYSFEGCFLENSQGFPKTILLSRIRWNPSLRWCGSDAVASDWVRSIQIRDICFGSLWKVGVECRAFWFVSLRAECCDTKNWWLLPRIPWVYCWLAQSYLLRHPIEHVVCVFLVDELKTWSLCFVSYLGFFTMSDVLGALEKPCFKPLV